MKATEKRISVNLTKENIKELEELKTKLGESYNAVIKRAIILLHYITFKKTNED